MSHNYLSAFARVSEGGDGNRATTQSSGLTQTYQQLAAFGMQSNNTSMFPTVASVNATPAHSHQQTSGQQTAMLPESQGQQSWVQNIASRPMIPTGNVPVGTPLLEWNGTEWIPPQQSSLAAVAASQQVSLSNTSVQSLSSTYTLSPLTSWNHQQQLDNHQQASNHNQHSQPQQSQPGQPTQQGQSNQPVSASFANSDSTRQHIPAKQPRKRAPKVKQVKQVSQLQTQHPQLNSVVTLGRSSSSEDLLSADQLARVTGPTPSKEDAAARDTLLALAAQTEMMRQQQAQQPEQPGLSEETVLTELTPVVQTKPASPTKPEPPPRPVRPFDGSFAVCPNCGTMSKNYNNCDFCKKELADDCRRYDPVKKKEEEAQKKREKQKKIETERLLIAKLKQEQQKKIQEANKSTSARASVEKVSLRGRPKASAKSIVPSTRSSYGRRIAVKDYSDSDPGWAPAIGSRAKSRGGGRVGGGAKRGRKPKEAEVFVISSESEEEYYPSPTRTRKLSAASPPATTSSTYTVSKGKQRQAVPTSKPDLTQVPELLLKCVKITMGSLEGNPKKPLHLSISGVDISLETDKNVVSITLDNRDVKECLCSTHTKLPVLIFKANATFGLKVRKALAMIDPEDDPYYDPDSDDARHKYIVAYLDDRAQISNLGWRLQDIFRAISLQYQTGSVLLRFIELQIAQYLLAKIAGKDGQSSGISALAEISLSYGDDDDVNKQSNPVVFEGLGETWMFHYPYPPAIGNIAITNEDYFCLQDGEFLNDTVISFYLKYLTEQVLSKEDQERTFVFSTFFYTKLTQSFSTAAGKDTKKSLAERRHSKVKNWTKNVDIFSKDFIIIPINEHSHWYLAIICFAHLDSPVYGQGDDNIVSSTTSEDVDLTEKAASKGSSKQTATPECLQQPATLSQHSDTDRASQSTNLDVTASSGSIEEVRRVATSSLADVSDALKESTATSPRHSSYTDNSEVEDLFGFETSEDEADPTADGQMSSQSSNIIKRPCILIFDSLAGPGHGPVIKALRDYLTIEWKVRRQGFPERTFGKEVMRGSNVKCPQQNNYSDCGIYLLQYVESFFKNPITNWSFPLKSTKDMFDYSVIKNKRKEIQKLMLECKKEFDKRPKPTPGRGRPRTTRQSVAAAHASVDKKPKATTHSTTVPEALGLAQTPRKDGPLVEGSGVPSQTASSESSGKQEHRPSKETSPLIAKGEKVIFDVSSNQLQSLKRPGGDLPISILPAAGGASKPSVGAVLSADTVAAKRLGVSGVRQDVEHMEVGDNSLSLPVSHTFASSQAVHISDSKDKAEHMQTDTTRSDLDESSMQTDCTDT